MPSPPQKRETARCLVHTRNTLVGVKSAGAETILSLTVWQRNTVYSVLANRATGMLLIDDYQAPCESTVNGRRRVLKKDVIPSSRPVHKEAASQTASGGMSLRANE